MPKMVIEDVYRISVEELKTHDGIEILERSIIVLDKNGNTLEIVFRANDQAMLEFYSMDCFKEGWYIPKPYKGSKAFDREEEE